MATLEGTIRVEDIDSLKKLVEADLIVRIKRVVNDSIPSVRNAVEFLVKRAIETSPEYTSLFHGRLAGHLGVPASHVVVQDLVEVILASIHVGYIPGLGLGGLTVGILQDDFQDLLSQDFAEYVSVNRKTRTQTVVPWLRWLLLEGANKVVIDFEMIHATGITRATSTSKYVMVQPKRVPRGFSLSPEYQGTKDNNWLTRAVKDLPEVVLKTMEQELLKRF